MSNAAQTIQAGFKQCLIHRKDTDGYAAGILGTLANGEDAGAYEMLAVKTADLSVPEPDRTDITGSNILQGAFTWPLGASPRGSVEAAVYDQDLYVALEGTKKVAFGGTEYHVLGGKEADPKDILLILINDAVSKTTGYKGLKKSFGYIVPGATAVVLGLTSITQRQELSARLALTVQSSDRLPWGEVLTLLTQGVTEGLMIPFSSDYMPALHAFRGDGATTTVVLDYTPAGDDTASPQRVLIYNNGVAMTTTTDFTVTVATKTVTFQAGHIPAAADKVEIWYEHV